jgi:hypothetical protein
VAGSTDKLRIVKNSQLLSFLYKILGRSAWTAVLFLCFHSASAAQEQKSFKDSGSEVAERLALSTKQPVKDCRIIFLGFVGALEPANNKYSGVVQIRKVLQEKKYSDVCARSFSPYAWTDGRDWMLKHFPSNAGVPAPDELQQRPKVIMVGHSMGGWAMMSVARELRNRDIPVELTIQIDSVGITDYTIPRNVKAAAIFHANDVLMFMTTKHLRREDPNYTKVVADVIVEGAGHESITRDPRIRELVMQTVESLRTAIASNSIPGVPPPPAENLQGGPHP